MSNSCHKNWTWSGNHPAMLMSPVAKVRLSSPTTASLLTSINRSLSEESRSGIGRILVTQRWNSTMSWKASARSIGRTPPARLIRSCRSSTQIQLWSSKTSSSPTTRPRWKETRWWSSRLPSLFTTIAGCTTSSSRQKSETYRNSSSTRSTITNSLIKSPSSSKKAFRWALASTSSRIS